MRSILFRVITFGCLMALGASCAPSESSLPSLTSTADMRVTEAPTRKPTKPNGKVPSSSAGQKPAGSNPTALPNPIAPAGQTVILGRPTANAVTLSLLSSEDRQETIFFGTESQSSANRRDVTVEANQPLFVELSDLWVDTLYYYRIQSADAMSEERTFHTQRATGSSFTFTIDADPHYGDPNFNGALYAIALADALADHPDFHINLGDTFMTEKAAPKSQVEASASFTGMRPYLGIVGAGAPLFLVNGNHEGELGWLLTGNPNTLPIWSTRLRQQYYPNPEPNGFYSGSSSADPALGGVRDSYFAWTWGDALCVVLDPFWYSTEKPNPSNLDSNWNYTLGQQQYDWLKSTLETSSAKYKFVFIHNLVGGNDKDGRGGIEAVPFFEWGGNNADGSYGFDAHRPGWGKPIHQLLLENHVNAVFHGHDHVLVKQDLDGVVYQEVPQPSMAQYNNTRMAAEYGYTHGDVLGSSGYMRVTLASEGVTVEYVRVYLPQDEKPGQRNGQVDFHYQIIPR
jgi:hypothetical protein